MADGFTPPQEVRANAKRGLELRDKYNRGGTEVGVARARDLSNGASLSLDTIKRMNSYFARHEVDKQGEGWGKDSAGYIAWLLWGGDAAWSWVKGILKDQEKKDKSMTQDFANSYAEIIKQEKQEDGTLLVYGKATDDSLDIDQQICDDAWLSKAMPDWFRTGGNIREQHSNIAAGVAKEYEAKSDGHYIRALVVDPISVKKVETGVLKGFSIGIKAPRILRDTKAANGRIVDGQIVEISLVDRPANPNAKLVLAKSVEGATDLVQVEEMVESAEVEKRDVSTEERQQLAERGAAMPDGSYPIKTIADLKNAIQAFGRAKDPAAVKRHIIRRARALNAIDQLPEGWNVKKSALAETILELHKSANSETVKFDQASYDTARRALAQLIIVEAGEMAESGSDERDSIDELMDALKHLFRWYEGEADEGEAMPMDALLEMKGAYKSDDCDCDGCKACKDDGGCDSNPCDKCMAVAADKEKSVNKCLECGCHIPGDSHGKDTVQIAGNNAGISTTANVSTAGSMDTSGSIKSAEGETPAEEATEAPAEETKEILDESEISEIVEEAVKSATEKVKTEIALKAEAAIKAAEAKAIALESELELAKSAAAAGGPKRTGHKIAETQENALMLKAAQYAAKAQIAQSTDPELAKGYKALEKEFLKKAGKAVDEDN